MSVDRSEWRELVLETGCETNSWQGLPQTCLGTAHSKGLCGHGCVIVVCSYFLAYVNLRRKHAFLGLTFAKWAICELEVCVVK